MAEPNITVTELEYEVPINTKPIHDDIDSIPGIVSGVSAVKPKHSIPSETFPLMTGRVETGVQTIKPKKLRGMVMDPVYKEYHGRFVEESTFLMEYIELYRKILKESKAGIPEEVIGEIDSSIGQAKLLLDSKLPQFGDLLYKYLRRFPDAEIVLSQDLEGWWDVAMLSIEQVKNQFIKLEELSNNNWKSIPKTKRTLTKRVWNY